LKTLFVYVHQEWEEKAMDLDKGGKA
jgi:hypothetical protein